MNKVCDIIKEGEIIGTNNPEFPLFHAVLYGDKIATEKFSKRLSCAIKHLPLRVKFRYVHDTLKAVDMGISKDPTLVVDGNIFLEGLVQAEEITEAFEKLIEMNNSMDETNKGIENLKKEIRGEVRAILKLNMTFEG